MITLNEIIGQPNIEEEKKWSNSECLKIQIQWWSNIVFFYFLSFIQWTKTISRKQKLERNGTDRTNEWMNESNRKQQQQNDSKVYLYISIYFIYGNEINNPRKRIRFE